MIEDMIAISMGLTGAYVAQAAQYNTNLAKRIYKQHCEEMSIYGSSSWINKFPVLASKCASCGSREFKEHRGVMVCSYCRSTK